MVASNVLMFPIKTCPGALGWAGIRPVRLTNPTKYCCPSPVWLLSELGMMELCWSMLLMLVLKAGNASAEHGWVVGQLQKSDRLPARPSSAHGVLVLGPKCPLVEWAGCSLLTV